MISLFSTKICRNFTPGLGFPLNYGSGVGVFFKPANGASYQIEDHFVFRGFWQFGITAFFPDPAHGRFGIGIYYPVAILLL